MLAGKSSSHYNKTALAHRCAREYKWAQSTAQSYVNEFLDKFIPIKKYLNDFNDRICSAPPTLNKVWIIALTYTQQYQDLCGESFIHHSPDHEEFDPIEVKNERYKATLKAYEELFGDVVDEIAWKCPIVYFFKRVAVESTATGANRRPSDEEATTSPQIKRRRIEKQTESGADDDHNPSDESEDDSDHSPSDASEYDKNAAGFQGPDYPKERLEAIERNVSERTVEFTISVMTLVGTTYKIQVSGEHLVEEMKMLVANQNGPPMNCQRLLFGGQQLLDDHRTLAEYKIKSSVTVHLIVRPCYY